MDDRVWTEQVEAALESGDRSFLHALASLAPNTARPEVALTRCRLQVALGDAAAAGAAFPPLHDVEETPALHRAWAAAAVDLALAGAIPNHWGLGRALTRLAEQAMARSDAADALDILERHVRAALARGARQVALRGVELAQAVVDPPDPDAPRLSRRRRRAGMDAVAALAQAVDDAPPVDPALPASPADLLTDLGPDPERDLDRLAAALEAWPGRPELLHSAARCWQALDDDAAGTDLFARAVAARPQDVELATAFGWHLVRRRDLPTLDAFVQHRFLADPEPATRARGHWLLARARLDRGATGTALAAVDRMLALQPDSLPGLHLRAQVLRADGHEAEALAVLDGVAARPQATPELHWDRMELGTLLGRWDSVRDSASRLDMPILPGNEPIDEVWGPCRVHLPWAAGAAATRAAIRTGPVTARLEHTGELVLLRAEALPEAEAEVEGTRWAGPLMRALRVLQRP